MPSCTRCTRRRRCATRWWSDGGRRRRPRARPTAPPSPSAPSPHRRTANGSRACCGRGSASAWRAGARRGVCARPAAAAALVVEVPLLFEAGMDAAFDATLVVVADEAVRHERAGARGHEALDERTARQLTRRRRPPGRRTRSQTPGTSRNWSRSSPGYLRSCSSDERTVRHSQPAPGAPAARRAQGARARPGCSRRGRSSARGRGGALRRASTTRCKEIVLPLRHDDIIRQQAADKGLDPALIAGVIYTESRFRDQTSHAGAKGLMQPLPLDRRRHRPQVRRHGLRPGRPRRPAGQHLLRLVLPALSAPALRGQHGARDRRLQRRRGAGRPGVFAARHKGEA